MAIATPAAQTKSLELVCPAGNLPSPVSYTHLFVEVIIAPAVTPEALAATASKQNVRVLACGQWAVSYTHLDVYKRQLDGRGRFGCSTSVSGRRARTRKAEQADRVQQTGQEVTAQRGDGEIDVGELDAIGERPNVCLLYTSRCV